MRKSMLAVALWVSTALLVTACSSGGSDSSTPPPAGNTIPVANSGPDQTVDAGVTVTLDGSGSSDADGTLAAYTWTQTAGSPTVTLSNRTVAQPTFQAPTVTGATTLTFSLIVRDDRGANSTTSTVDITVNPPAAGTVSGRVRFTRIPTTASNGLNYGNPQLQPARGVLVRAVAAGDPTNVLATATTDANGDYTMSVAGNTDINVIVVSQMLRDGGQPLPRWNFRAQDADASNPAPYTFSNGEPFNSDAGTGRDIDIPSGFNSSGAVTGTRASAPFAVLDTVYQAVQLVLSAAPTTNFPELVLDWSTDNPGGETYFDFSGSSTQLIVLSADPTEDTDEFDQHVIAHEFGHYIEANFSRADNIGGAHGLGDKLDIRVAFGEGFGYAFGAIVLDDPVSIDTFVNSGTRVSSTFNVETNPSTNPPGTPSGNFGCWCSESSVWSVLWDLFDSNADANDTLALGFQPIWNVLVSDQRTTPAFTSIFSFISSLKDANSADIAAIDALVAAQNTSNIADIWGTGESHVPTGVASAAALPLYTDISIGGPAVTVRNVNDAGTYNALGNRRYLRFTVNSTRSVTVTATSANPSDPDPDFLVWRAGTVVSVAFDPPAMSETATFPATAGTYLIDVYDCSNGCTPDGAGTTPGDYNLTVTVN